MILNPLSYLIYNFYIKIKHNKKLCLSLIDVNLNIHHLKISTNL